MLVDSHCHLNHLDLEKLNTNLAGVLKNAYQQGIRYILTPSVTLEEFSDVINIVGTYVDKNNYPSLYAAVALHPSEQAITEPTVDDIVQLAKHPKVVAIGETGLDYFYEYTDQVLQRERFIRHIQAAVIINKPLIVHMRDAAKDTFDLLKQNQAEKVRGVMHCFTGNWEAAKTALDLGFYISFSGILTFKKAVDLKEIARQVPLNRLLIETDAPYLSPEPVRHKANEPANVRYVATYLAQFRNIDFETLANETSQNFIRLFLS